RRGDPATAAARSGADDDGAARRAGESRQVAADRGSSRRGRADGVRRRPSDAPPAGGRGCASPARPETACRRRDRSVAAAGRGAAVHPMALTRARYARLLVGVVLGAGVAQAAEGGEPAEQLFNEGVEAARRGDWEQARAGFEAAQSLSSRPVILINLAGAQA